MAPTFSSHRTFLREFRRQFHTTGAILPSSRFLAAALARYVREGRDEAAQAPRRVLEVGPGTGSVTDKIVDALGPTDRLDLVEINEEFVALLERRFAEEPKLIAVADRVRILNMPIEEAADGEPYDRIVSGLPLNNFEVADVQRILGVLEGLLKPGGRLSFFEYFFIRGFRAVVSRGKERERLRGIGTTLGEMFRRHEIRRELIWLNTPPAWVHHIQFENGKADA
ncbi:MAG TPA: methyltransferase [Thermoguttaceae bacterium]|nr:methyltransferase [Thermoguttaceae bacterium]